MNNQQKIHPDLQPDFKPEMPESHHLPNWIWIVVIAIIGLLVIGLVAYGAYQYISKQYLVGCITLYEPVCSKDGKTYSNSCVADLDGAEVDYMGKCEADELVYKNEEYGFELTLAGVWKDYKIRKSEAVGLGEKNIYFLVSDTSTKGGYAEPFVISVYSAFDWDILQEEEGPKPIYISQNDQYIFAYSQWQDPPINLIGVDFEVSQIISTFKFID